MSAADLTWLSTETNRSPGWTARRKKWWARVSARCAASNCPKLGKLWPSWLHKSDGVEFDGRWYCSRQCLEGVLVGRVHSLLSSFSMEKPRTHRFPIGLLLVSRQVISSAQLREAIRLQREAGHGKLGDWLRQTADLSVHDLTAALGQQWGCPVFPLEIQSVPASWCDLVPIPLLESATAVPAHASSNGRVLHVAFGKRVDHTLLYAVELMLGCRTHPCVAPAAAVQTQLEQFRRLSSGNDTCFDTVREPAEMAWTICNYAVELRAARLAVVRAGSFIWTRFLRSQSSRDLLFRILPDGSGGFFDRSSAQTKALASLADGRKGGVSDASLQL
jgi:hypothetical protein